MEKREILVTDIFEMQDMISCLSIYNGVAKPKKKKLSFDEILQLR